MFETSSKYFCHIFIGAISDASLAISTSAGLASVRPSIMSLFATHASAALCCSSLGVLKNEPRALLPLKMYSSLCSSLFDMGFFLADFSSRSPHCSTYWSINFCRDRIISIASFASSSLGAAPATTLKMTDWSIRPTTNFAMSSVAAGATSLIASDITATRTASVVPSNLLSKCSRFSFSDNNSAPPSV